VQRSLDRQGAFAAGLLDPARPVPAGLVGPDGKASAKRYAVYRNNVVVGLIDALKASFPAVCRIVGEVFFRAMARAYVTRDPPKSPILIDYGARFPSFISSFEPVVSLPYLADVARIERAWLEAYHSAEAEPLSPAAFAAIPGESVSDLCLDLHPSLRIVRSGLPALTIWRMNVGDGAPGPVDLDAGGEDALVIRPAAGVEARSMAPGGAELVVALAAGDTLADAAQSALRAAPGLDLSMHLAALIGAGAFIGCRLPEAVRDTMNAAVET
jgi:hypothetical protein